MTLYRIVPKEGLLIPMETGGDLPATGLVVPAVDLYWRRREADGDVVVTEEAVPATEAAEAAPDAVDPAAKTSKRVKE